MHLQGGEAVQLGGAGVDHIQAGEYRLQRSCPSDSVLQRQLQAGKCSVHLCHTSIGLHLCVQQQQDLCTVGWKLWQRKSLHAIVSVTTAAQSHFDADADAVIGVVRQHEAIEDQQVGVVI